MTSSMVPVLPREKLAREGRLAKDVVAVRVAGKLCDLMTPVDSEASLEVVRDCDPDGLRVLRHSAAHVMADAVQRLFPGTKVTIGPAIEDGFYYDFDRPGGAFTEEDLAKIEAKMAEIIRQDTPFVRAEVGRDEAIALFSGLGETFKVEIIQGTPEGEVLTLYRHGEPGKSEWVDFCEGPHVPSTGRLKAIKLTSVAGAYWRGDERNPMLQRIYGTAFHSKPALDEHIKMLEEAKKRDHRKLGRELDLFMFHEYAPAMPFFLPRGAFVYQRLTDYLRELYVDYGYQEVMTPQIFDERLFETSGHLANYAENLYRVTTEAAIEEWLKAHPIAEKQGLEVALRAAGVQDPSVLSSEQSMLRYIVGACRLAQKPMNCPSHCLIYGSRRRSYRELPWRVADFGRLHRFERGGVVHGLTRVRTFCQDDAHIFCPQEKIQSEIQDFVDLLYQVYNALDLKEVKILLATRPEKRVGTEAQWDAAEAGLAQALREKNLDFEFSPGEGAFYGPKLEFHVRDALKRSWQLGTIQVDYALPDRFGLEYTGDDGAAHRPVMLHRAILGSLERFMGVFIEHVGGAFPVWLSPEQVSVVTVSEKHVEYARQAIAVLQARGVRTVSDLGPDKLGAKIRNARLMRYPYIAVVGDKEATTRTLSVRSREQGELGALALEAFADKVATESKSPRIGGRGSASIG